MDNHEWLGKGMTADALLFITSDSVSVTLWLLAILHTVHGIHFSDERQNQHTDRLRSFRMFELIIKQLSNIHMKILWHTFKMKEMLVR